MSNVIFFDFIDVHLLAIGFLGGMVRAFRIEKVTPWQVLVYIVTGGLAANFIAPQVLKILTFAPSGFVAFGVGMSGKRLCYVVEKFFDKLDLFGRTKNG